MVAQTMNMKHPKKGTMVEIRMVEKACALSYGQVFIRWLGVKRHHVVARLRLKENV